MVDLLSNGLHEKVMIWYFSKSKLDVEFIKKIYLEIVIDQQMKEEGHE